VLFRPRSRLIQNEVPSKLDDMVIVSGFIKNSILFFWAVFLKIDATPAGGTSTRSRTPGGPSGAASVTRGDEFSLPERDGQLADGVWSGV